MGPARNMVYPPGLGAGSRRESRGGAPATTHYSSSLLCTQAYSSAPPFSHLPWAAVYFYFH